MSKLTPAQGRGWWSALPTKVIEQIQYAHALSPTPYTYKDIIMWKNPFDLALYTKLIWDQKPQTIIEIGSFRGASAMWFADQMSAYDLQPNVVSVDINPVEITYPGVQFLTGDARKLSQVFDELDYPRPWLVIDDASHIAGTSFLILEYFHKYLQKDEFIIVEDSIISLLGESYEENIYAGGPALAISLFLQRHPDDYTIDERYCDYYGYNVTWNINGYLRRI